MTPKTENDCLFKNMSTYLALSYIIGCYRLIYCLFPCKLFGGKVLLNSIITYIYHAHTRH